MKTKITIYFTAILFFGIFGLAKSSWAATYYVRTDGNNNCNGLADTGGSSGNCAFRTIQKAIDIATSPGDIVNIRGDHRNEGLIKTKADGCNGSSCDSNSTYITIQAHPDAELYSAMISPGIQINHSYIIVKGFGITGSYCGPCGNAAITFGWNGAPKYSRALNNHIYNPSQPVNSYAIIFGFSASQNIADGNLIEGDDNPLRVGGHNTGSGGTTLRDDTLTWTNNQWQGRPIWNLTPTSESWAGTDAGVVISNDDHSITTSNNINWNNNDCYAVGSSFMIVVAFTGANNTFSHNIVRNLMGTERIFDGMTDGTVLDDNEIYDLKDPNEYKMSHGLYTVADDNCGTHTDIFQVVSPNPSNSVVLRNNYFHDCQSQTGMLDGTDISNWVVENNIFANITHRNTIGGRNFKFYNNTLFNVANGETDNPFDEWYVGEEYKNNIIIGGSNNPNFGIIGSGPMGSWQECAKNVINKTWKANTSISNWIGQGGVQAILTANGSVYASNLTSGTTGNNSPNWTDCSKIGQICNDNGIAWTNVAWNANCNISGTKDVIFGDQWGWNWKKNVTDSFICNPSAVPEGDPRIYDAEGIKVCKIKDNSEQPASNNYYGIWNSPIYSPRTNFELTQTGEINFLNGGNPKFISAYTDCINNNCDFRLQSGSPLIGKGIYISSVLTDKNGFPRSNPPSIGAYEYTSDSNDTTPPTSPSGLIVW